jgi:hypothetical protein
MLAMAVFIAYWWMRATDRLAPLFTPGGLIPGRGASGAGGHAGGSAGGAGASGASGAGGSAGGGAGAGTRSTWRTGAGGAGATPWRDQLRGWGKSTGAGVDHAGGWLDGLGDWGADRIDDWVAFRDEAEKEARRRRKIDQDRADWDSRNHPNDDRSRLQRRRDRRNTCPACGHTPDARNSYAADGCPCQECACMALNPTPRRPPEPPSPPPGPDGGGGPPPPDSPPPTPGPEPVDLDEPVPAGRIDNTGHTVVDGSIEDLRPQGSDGADQPIEVPSNTNPALPAGTSGGDMTAPVIDVDEAKVRQCYAVLAHCSQQLEALAEGLTAKNMDPASLANLDELREHMAGVSENIHSRHDRMQEAVDDTEHPANTNAYTED